MQDVTPSRLEDGTPWLSGPALAVFQSVRDPVLLADDDGRLLDVNPAGCDLLRYPTELLRCIRLSDIADGAAAGPGGALRRLCAEGTWNGPVTLRRADGAALPTEARVTAANVAGGAIFVILLTDAPARVNSSGEARAAHDEFLATLGHELRSPLGAISSAFALLTADPPGPEERRSRWTEVRPVLERQLKAMTRMVDDILDAGRLAGGKLELHVEPVDLTVVLGFALQTAMALAERFGHDIAFTHPDQPVMTLCDPVRTEQVAVNLLNNAAKYTPAGGRIVMVLERDGDDAVFHVRDNGDGIAPEFLPHLFEPFAQAHRDSAGARDGLGLGLTVVKSLVEQHGGAVSASSPGVGLGSTLTVRLPALPDEARHA